VSEHNRILSPCTVWWKSCSCSALYFRSP